MSEAFLLGLSTGTYCAAACFPVAIPFLFSESANHASNARLLGFFLLGRLAAYSVAGFLLGSMGQWAAVAGAQAISRWLPAVYLVLGASMMYSGFRPRQGQGAFCGWLQRLHRPGGSAFGFGLLTSLNLCPPFIAAASRVFGHPGGLSGTLYFVLFFSGTTLFFLPLLGIAWLQRREPLLRAAGRVALVLVGGYFALVLGFLRLVQGSNQL